MEILSIHSGQTGTNIGLECWDHFLGEHYLLTDGSMDTDNPNFNELLEYNTFFEEIDETTFKPRALFVDCESSNAASITEGHRKNLFGPNQIITGDEDTAHVYSKGYGEAGGKIIDAAMEEVRKMSEDCNCLQGFLFYRSLGGGTGTGFTSLLTDRLNEEFEKKGFHDYSILPGSHLLSPSSDIYNIVLSINNTLKTPKCSFMFDNDILNTICTEKLGIKDPSHSSTNMVMARIISAITSSLRFQGALNVDMEDYRISLIPSARLCFPMVSFAPIFPVYKKTEPTIHDIIESCFEKENQLMDCDVSEGDFIAASLMFSGDVRVIEANKTMRALRSADSVNFVKWCPRIFKAGFNPRPTNRYPKNEMARTKKQLCMMTNNTAIGNIFKNMNYRFNQLFKKKEFLHQFTSEGMEEQEFVEASENLKTLSADYNTEHKMQYY